MAHEQARFDQFSIQAEILAQYAAHRELEIGLRG